MRMSEAATTFLASGRIAVTGVSRTPQGHGSNAVFDRLRERGYDVVPVNPAADRIGESPCYPDLASVPGGADAVVIGTAAGRAMDTMREVVELGIRQVWMHRSFGPGSLDPEAARFGREHGVTVIPGGCPLMFGDASDGGHRFMCRLFTLTGRVPRQV